MSLALEIIGAHKTFFEEDPEATHPWWRLWQSKPRRLVTAVNQISLSVKPGEIYGILGPNGSGKSTLIRLISTLLIPDSGTVSVFGCDVVRQTVAVRRMINRVSVDAAFFKKLSARENLDYAARLYGLDLADGRQRSGEILERTKSKRDVQDFIVDIQQQQNTTVILTSHDMTEAERLCGRIAFIADGSFLAEGTALQLKARFKAHDMEDLFLKVTGKSVKEEEVAQ